ncbi:hypothetical protein AB0M39_03840 [Streptomyces sp. NPDC051907]|uniref:hypothetical protein n=1 Tax=Streptomyces sp. NPDC051907 TaxID=3155284 RepID=UPI0034436FAF
MTRTRSSTTMDTWAWTTTDSWAAGAAASGPRTTLAVGGSTYVEGSTYAGGAR